MYFVRDAWLGSGCQLGAKLLLVTENNLFDGKAFTQSKLSCEDKNLVFLEKLSILKSKCKISTYMA